MYFSKATLISALFGLTLARESSSGAMTSSSGSSGSAAGGMLKMHVVQVGGPNGSLAFFPNNVAAEPGDMVQFQFHPKNHSVVQSTFDNPCIPIQNMMPNKTDAFFSGFMPTNASFAAKNQVLTYTIRVPDTKPIWFYCSQAKHCQAGMVGAINAPASGNKTMTAFAALAAKASESLSPGEAAGSGGSTGSTGSGSSGSSGNTPTSPTSGNGASSGSGGSAAGGSAASGSGVPQASANAAADFSARSSVGFAAAMAAVAFSLL